MFKLLRVKALCSYDLAMSKSSSRFLIISFSVVSSDTASLNSNFNLLQHSHLNSLSSGVLFVKSGIAPSYTTVAAAIMKQNI